MKVILAAFLAALLTLGGCASRPIDQPTAKIAIQYGTMKFIRNDPARAAKVERVVSAVRAQIDGDSLASVDYIKMTIQSYLPLNMAPEDRFAVNSLIDLVVAELKARINEQTLPPDVELQVRTVADWILEAAAYYPQS